MDTTLTPEQRSHFEQWGYVRVGGAFSTSEAAAMRDVVWDALAERGVDRADPTTWSAAAADHLQHLRPRVEFRAVGSRRTMGAIADLLGAERAAPRDWGAFFLLFPGAEQWEVPASAWHVDHDWHSPTWPIHGLKVHAMFGDVAPRAGAMTIVAGAHHVIPQLLEGHPELVEARAARVRRHVMTSHPYLRELGRAAPDGSDRQARIERYVDRTESVLGHELQVREMTAEEGDVILMHPLTLHTRPVHAGRRPRFLLNKDLYPQR